MSQIRLLTPDDAFQWLQASASTAGKPALKRFKITAYTGGPMDVGYGLPVVVDLEGMEVPHQNVPIFRDHDTNQIIGHAEQVEKTPQRLKLSGVMSGVGPAAQEVVALAGNGFPWQASIGANIGRMEKVDQGESVTVNGKVQNGPLYVARKTTLRETSFVASGADCRTSTTVSQAAPLALAARATADADRPSRWRIGGVAAPIGEPTLSLVSDSRGEQVVEVIASGAFQPGRCGVARSHILEEELDPQLMCDFGESEFGLTFVSDRLPDNQFGAELLDMVKSGRAWGVSITHAVRDTERRDVYSPDIGHVVSEVTGGRLLAINILGNSRPAWLGTSVYAIPA